MARPKEKRRYPTCRWPQVPPGRGSISMSVKSRMPAFCSRQAAASPAMPPPTMTTPHAIPGIVRRHGPLVIPQAMTELVGRPDDAAGEPQHFASLAIAAADQGRQTQQRGEHLAAVKLGSDHPIIVRVYFVPQAGLGLLFWLIIMGKWLRCCERWIRGYRISKQFGNCTRRNAIAQAFLDHFAGRKNDQSETKIERILSLLRRGP